MADDTTTDTLPIEVESAVLARARSEIFGDTSITPDERDDLLYQIRGTALLMRHHAESILDADAVFSRWLDFSVACDPWRTTCSTCGEPFTDERPHMASDNYLGNWCPSMYHDECVR